MPRAPRQGPIRYAVVGLGHIAQVAVLPAFAHAKKNSVLTALVSGDATKRRQLGRKYRVEQSVGLYPTAGSTDDYAYSRHFIDPSKAKIIAYTMEWGRTRVSTPFHPPYPEMRKVMREVTAGLLEFCVQATNR